MKNSKRGNKVKMRKYKYNNTTTKYILYIVAITILFSLMITIDNSYINDNNVSALDYSSNVGIGFTFNPTLSVSLSSSDLVIPNLVPGSTLDSNSINISVATNASYGYTLSATVGDSTHNNSNLTHSNNIDIFSSIDTDSSLPSLTTDNTWGYNTSLDSGSTWSNYNGLSSSSSTTLLDKDSNISSSIDFKIGAKASSVQPSGTYTNTITFTAVTKPTPMNLAESYFAAGKTRHNGYYAMQDMTAEICNNTEVIGEGSQTELIDLRDDKVYWATKLADGHCWMTQNLDLDLDSSKTYTHWDTDLGWGTENGNAIDENATWQPNRSTIDFTIGSTISGWQDSNTEPYSANPGDVYFYTSNSDADDIQYGSLQECINANHNDCTHYHAGNYYNWSAAVGSNDTTDTVSGDALDSICPTRWQLPKISEDIFSNLANLYNIKLGSSLRIPPLYFVRSGFILSTQLSNIGKYTGYWSSTAYNDFRSYRLYFGPGNSGNSDSGRRLVGFSVRCLAR